MKLTAFRAYSAADAVTQIRSQLGPEAVVVNVRQLPAEGLARFWQRPKIEVLAYKPEPAGNGGGPDAGAIAELRQELNQIKSQFRSEDPSLPPQKTGPGKAFDPIPAESGTPREAAKPGQGGWRIGSVLESTGLFPLHAQRILEQLQTRNGAQAPTSLSEEIRLAQNALSQHWRKPQPFVEQSMRPHILVGPSGAGKTTCLCKWLTQITLVEERPVRVWRLDGATANTAESLSVYGDILGIPVERAWQVNEQSLESAIGFIDLPGIDWRNPEAMAQLGAQIKGYLSPHVHLVLNAAYEIPLLMAQARAFSALPVEDIILTHLDEEIRWGKIWNLVLGTNFSVRYLSAGQNIPGDFIPANPEKIFQRQFSL